MTFSKTNTFTNGTLANADEVNANYDEIATELNATTKTGTMWNLFAPVGSVFAWLKTYTNTPALPTGWVECDGSVLSDADSVYNGQTLPDLNGGEFLKGNTTSGGTGGSTTSSVTNNMDFEGATPSGAGSETVGAQSFAIVPTYYDVVWIMRIK